MTSVTKYFPRGIACLFTKEDSTNKFNSRGQCGRNNHYIELLNNLNNMYFDVHLEGISLQCKNVLKVFFGLAHSVAVSVPIKT